MTYATSLRVTAVLLLSTSSLVVRVARGEDQLTPHDPILGRVPDVALCMVTFKYKDDAQSSLKGGGSTTPISPRIATIQTEKRGSVYRQITTLTNGAKKENWSVNGEQICKNVYSDSYIHVAAGNPLYVDLTTSDFGELTWVGMDNYVGVSKGEPKVFIFSVKNTDRHPTAEEKEEYSAQSAMYQSTLDSKANTAQRSVVIKKELDQYIQQKFGDTESRVTLDVLTQLPVEYDDGKVVRTYTYSDKVEPLSAPVSVMRAMQYWAALARSTRVRPSPP